MCMHTGCKCQADPGSEFCGEYCRDHSAESEHADHACECGHAACQV